MSIQGTLIEIENQLPNGFHDAYLEAFSVDYTSMTVEMEMNLSVGDPDAATEIEKEGYKKAILYLCDLVYIVIDSPTCIQKHPLSRGMRIDAGDANDLSNTAAPKPILSVPNGIFTHWFYIRDWNSFIHVAARDAKLCWQ
jgi:hypothetical protein